MRIVNRVDQFIILIKTFENYELFIDLFTYRIDLFRCLRSRDASLFTALFKICVSHYHLLLGTVY